MKRNGSYVLAIVLALIFVQCDNLDEGTFTPTKLDLPATPFNYNVPGASDELVTLGRVMFYDPRLSVNNTVSCGSCHKQALAFSDNVAFSLGFENRLTARNSMPIQNIISNVFNTTVAPNVEKSDSIISQGPIPMGGNQPGGYLPGAPTPPDFFLKSTSLFWDGRETELDVMVTRPIINHVEMGIHDLETLAQKLSQLPEYESLSAKAFSTEGFTSRNISLGLSAFLLSIRSTNSKFDKMFNLGDPLGGPNNSTVSALTGLEEQGRDLFFNKFNCNNCHEKGGFANIGLDSQPEDAGKFAVTGNPMDIGKFKIPSLRNIELTGPYMHDGRFKTLDEVLDHYSEGIANNPNLDFRFRDFDGSARQLNITPSEKKSIIAFLKTLTDYEMITDQKLSNPFKAN